MFPQQQINEKIRKRSLCKAQRSPVFAVEVFSRMYAFVRELIVLRENELPEQYNTHTHTSRGAMQGPGAVSAKLMSEHMKSKCMSQSSETARRGHRSKHEWKWSNGTNSGEETCMRKSLNGFNMKVILGFQTRCL